MLNRHSEADDAMSLSAKGEVEWFNEALAQMQSLPDSHDKVFGLLKLGYLAIVRDDMKLEASQILQDAWQLAKRLSDKQAAAYAAGYLGKLYEKAKRYREVERFTQQAIELTRQSEVPKLLSLPQSQPDQSNWWYYAWKPGQEFVSDML